MRELMIWLLSGSHSLESRFVNFVVTPWPDSDNQNFDNLGVNTVHDTDITATDTAATGQFA